MKKRKSLLSFAAVLLAAVLLLSGADHMFATQASAASSSAIQDQIDELEEERKGVQAEMAKLNEKITNTNSEIDKLVSEKNVIDQEIGLLTEEIKLINDQIQAYGRLIADKQEELDAAQKKLEDLTQRNKDRIRTMEEEGSLSYWSVLFRANDFSDLLDRLNMIEEIANADRRRLDSMREAREEVRVAQEELNTQKDALEETRMDLEENQTLLAQKRVEADQKLAELNTRNNEYKELMEAAEEADNALMQEIALKQREYNDAKRAEDAATAPPKPSGGGSTTTVRPPATVTDGITWVMPCAYTRLSSPYGWRMHPVYKVPKFHDGVDLSNVSGTPIYAVRSGTVTIATYSSTAGYYVAINHGDGFASTYMHMTHFIVKAGQKVAAGQTIGYMGSTGVSTGPHLHFGMSYEGYSQNPADYLNFR